MVVFILLKHVSKATTSSNDETALVSAHALPWFPAAERDRQAALLPFTAAPAQPAKRRGHGSALQARRATGNIEHYRYDIHTSLRGRNFPPKRFGTWLLESSRLTRGDVATSYLRVAAIAIATWLEWQCDCH